MFLEKFGFRKIRILLLGSFYPRHFLVLNELKASLISKGFKSTNIASDLVEIPSDMTSDEKNAHILLKIKDLMIESDFNIFIFFSEGKNESTIVELTVLVESDYLREKLLKILIFFPRHYSSTMLEGLISLKKLKVYYYETESEIHQISFRYLKRTILESKT